MIFLKADHRVDWITTYPFTAFWPEAKDYSGHPKKKGDIVIGNDVWIGHGAMILSGVHIGNGAVVAAGSIVTKNVSPYCIVGGNPAKIIRYRFSSEQIDKLERIAWWNWPRSKIVQALPLLLSNNIDFFLAAYDSNKPAPDHTQKTLMNHETLPDSSRIHDSLERPELGRIGCQVDSGKPGGSGGIDRPG